MIDATTAVRSIRSTLCPACAGKKKQMRSLCFGCYRSLPRPMKGALYRLVGNGYEQALDDALKRLDVAEPALPQECGECKE